MGGWGGGGARACACAARSVETQNWRKPKQCLVLVKVTGPLYKSTVKIIFAVSTLFPDEVAPAHRRRSLLLFLALLPSLCLSFSSSSSNELVVTLLIMGFSIGIAAARKISRSCCASRVKNRRKWTLQLSTRQRNERKRERERERKFRRVLPRVFRQSFDRPNVTTFSDRQLKHIRNTHCHWKWRKSRANKFLTGWNKNSKIRFEILIL